LSDLHCWFYFGFHLKSEASCVFKEHTNVSVLLRNTRAFWDIIIALMMDAVNISETSVKFHETIRLKTSEGCHLHARRSKNLKSHVLKYDWKELKRVLMKSSCYDNYVVLNWLLYILKRTEIDRVNLLTSGRFTTQNSTSNYIRVVTTHCYFLIKYCIIRDSDGNAM
jgi:hypothetical protein